MPSDRAEVVSLADWRRLNRGSHRRPRSFGRWAYLPGMKETGSDSPCTSSTPVMDASDHLRRGRLRNLCAATPPPAINLGREELPIHEKRWSDAIEPSLTE